MSAQTTLAGPKSKSLMYEQQLAHLPAGTVDDLLDKVKQLGAKEWAMQVHDKDVRPDGQPVEDHVHVMMTFRNARSPRSVARALGDKAQYVQAWRGDRRNGYAYLCHRTKGASTKYQYDPADVLASFDYPTALATWSKGAQVSRQGASISVLLDGLYRGDVSRQEVLGQMSGTEVAKHVRAVDLVVRERLRREAVEWRKRMKDEGRTVDVFWLWGASETGKTSFAHDLARSRADERGFFMSGSSRGIFEGYDGQHVLVLDEFTPNVIPYSDLKRITDPFGLVDEVRAPARYQDAGLMAETIIITTPFDPVTLYRAQVAQAEDAFDQLARRITYPVRFMQDVIQPMRYNAQRQRYDVVLGDEQENAYSRDARKRAGTLMTPQAFGEVFSGVRAACASDTTDAA